MGSKRVQGAKRKEWISAGVYPEQLEEPAYHLVEIKSFSITC